MGSLDSAKSGGRSLPAKSKSIPPPTILSKSKKSKAAKLKASSTKSSKAGLTFPVGRIKRKLKSQLVSTRIGIGSAVYMAAIL